MKVAALLVLGVGSALGLLGVAEGQVGSKSKSMADIVGSLEKQGYVVVDCSMDDGNWEVEAYEKELAYELLIDPMSGKILSKHRDGGEPRPQAGAKPLSEILNILQKAGYTAVTEASYEHRNWEIEAYRGGTKRELNVDPKTGEVLSDRID